MPTRTEPWPAGTPCWVDLAVPDVAGAVAFYADVIGWTFVEPGGDHAGYQLAQVDGRTAAGVGQVAQEDQHPAWTVYFASDDIDATAKLIGEHGGSVFVGPMDVTDIGRLLVAADPTGGVFGVWQQTGMIGCEVQEEPGSFVWDDARLRDVGLGKRFYAEVFDLHYAPLPPEAGEVGDYETFTPPGGTESRPARGMGGMQGPPPGTPSHWLAYFTVADVDASVGAVGDGGGTVLRPPETTPFGRIGVVADPYGAVFGLHSAPASGPSATRDAE